jgi:ribose transport system permease protein
MNLSNVPTLVWRLLTFAVILLVIGGIFQLLAPVFLTSDNLHALFRHMAVQGIVAIGLTFVIVVRQFDLSLPGVASLGAMTLGFALSQDGNLLIAVAACAAVGLAVGLVNGIVVGGFRLPDVVATIAIGSIAYGLAFVYNGGSSYSDNFFTSGILDLNDGHVLGIDAPVVILVAIALVATLVLHLTRYGEGFYAAGENPRSAALSGIPVRAQLICAFSICGAMTSIAMLLDVSSAGAAYISTGSQVLMPAYTAVYVGAALFGTASIPATLAGVLMTATMLNGFTALTMPYYYSDLIVSAVLITAITVFDPRFVASLRSASALQFFRSRIPSA